MVSKDSGLEGFGSPLLCRGRLTVSRTVRPVAVVMLQASNSRILKGFELRHQPSAQNPVNKRSRRSTVVFLVDVPAFRREMPRVDQIARGIEPEFEAFAVVLPALRFDSQ